MKIVLQRKFPDLHVHYTCTYAVHVVVHTVGHVQLVTCACLVSGPMQCHVTCTCHMTEHWSREIVVWVQIPSGAAHLFLRK